jgi:hypothetical protein
MLAPWTGRDAEPWAFTASKEETYTNAMILMDRFEFVDA